MICRLLTIYYTVRYGLSRGMVYSGHDLQLTGETHNDHWQMQCTRCGHTAGTEVRP